MQLSSVFVSGRRRESKGRGRRRRNTKRPGIVVFSVVLEVAEVAVVTVEVAVVAVEVMAMGQRMRLYRSRFFPGCRRFARARTLRVSCYRKKVFQNKKPTEIRNSVKEIHSMCVRVCVYIEK